MKFNIRRRGPKSLKEPACSALPSSFPYPLNNMAGCDAKEEIPLLRLCHVVRYCFASFYNKRIEIKTNLTTANWQYLQLRF